MSVPDLPGLAKFRALLAKETILILDGAMGTELERRGYPTTLPLWSAEAAAKAPELVSRIHEEYIEAGADIITANTFRTTFYTMDKVSSGYSTEDLAGMSIDIALNAAANAGRRVLVAASIAPLEDCYSPEMVPDRSTIRTFYDKQINLLIKQGPDMILLETMINLPEIEIAAEILARKKIPFIISFLAGKDGCLLDGTPLEKSIDKVLPQNPVAVMLNCRPAAEMTNNLRTLATYCSMPIGVYANGEGTPGGQTGWTWDSSHHTIEEYIVQAGQWIDAGARIIGGCCGTTPAHISALAKLRSRFRSQGQ